MKLLNRLSVVLAGVMALQASAADLIYQGAAPEFAETLPTSTVSTLADPHSRYQISLILEAERRVPSVRESMDLKRIGLGYVQDLSDFEYLCTFTSDRPSAAYKTAVSQFIVDYAGAYVRNSFDIRLIQRLERAVETVSGAIQLKQYGLHVVRTMNDYATLVQFSVTNPSDAYKTAVADFIVRSIASIVSPRSSIDAILDIETRYTMTVAQAMAVKRAGLVAVTNKAQLLRLATYTVANPSPSYVAEVNAFIRAHLDRYPY